MKQFILKYYPFGIMLLLCIFYMYKAISFPLHDFANYYFGAQFLADGEFNTSIYFPSEFNKAIADLGFENIFVSYAPNTPFLAVFFLPFTMISVVKAKIFFNLISSFLLLLSCFRLFDFYKINLKYAILIPIVFFIPIKNNLLFGQVYFLLFFLLAESLIAYEKQQLKKMSLFLSLSIALKVFPILFLLLFIFKKQYKPLIYICGVCAFLFGISLLLTGLEVWVFFLKTVLPRASNGEIATAFVDNYQSVFMFLKRLLVYDEIENPYAFSVASSYFPISILAFKLGCISLGYFITRNSNNNLQIFSFWILASILLSPYGSTYTFIVLLFAFLTLAKSEISNFKKILLFGILFLTNNLSVSFFIENQFPFSYVRLFFLIAFFILFMIYFYKKSTFIKAFSMGCFVFFMGTFFKQNISKTSTSFLTEESPILIYDYKITNNQLTYFYWNEKGENTNSVPLLSNKAEKLELKNNQIYYNNKQLTFDKSNKLKPTLIDQKTILFLSDYERGIGFYTLQKLNYN
ncbi:glycosyltransferase family 87 protein [Flavobacterium soli]|uniref:glycosyltransferase family 87 protein n=1 Tax=Flavobacterium soli TaxID=344881 RepID=UPI00041AD7F9|nr:glycosyltransferase family 87 protein [Flavobacterium soli]